MCHFRALLCSLCWAAVLSLGPLLLVGWADFAEDRPAFNREAEVAGSVKCTAVESDGTGGVTSA